MAYSVDWVAKIITIPQGDLTFVSGNNYSLSMVDAHEELRRLEWAFADGLWAPQILNFFETVTLSGIPKSPSIEVINGYTLDFTGSNYNVILSDYDNNFVDVYIPSNGISILGNNSVGRQAVGSGLTAAQDARMERIEKFLRNRQYTNPLTGNIEQYDDADAAIEYEAPIYADDGVTSYDGTQPIVRRGRYETP